MYIDFIDEKLNKIQFEKFVNPEYYAGLDCDCAIDERNSHALFDSDWSHLYRYTEVRLREVSQDVLDRVDIIQKEVFLIVSRTTRQHEIASYVADDFDLICRCQALAIEHPIIDHLWKAYQCGIFPAPRGYHS